MTLMDRTQLVIEVLRGTDIERVAKAHGVPPRRLQRWLRLFLEAGIAALAREEKRTRRPLATIVPLYPDGRPAGGRQGSGSRGNAR